MRWPIFKRVDRLVAMAVLTTVAITWITIVSLDAFRIFIGELNDVGQGQYTLAKAAVYVLLTVPRRFYEMFGYAALIGSLLGLGGLAASGELTALRAAGLSKLRICASVALGLGILTLAVAVLRMGNARPRRCNWPRNRKKLRSRRAVRCGRVTAKP
jgi:lipopolysaccharide export system permease protein